MEHQHDARIEIPRHVIHFFRDIDLRQRGAISIELPAHVVQFCASVMGWRGSLVKPPWTPEQKLAQAERLRAIWRRKKLAAKLKDEL